MVCEWWKYAKENSSRSLAVISDHRAVLLSGFKSPQQFLRDRLIWKKQRNRVCLAVLLHLFIRPRFSQRCRFVRQDVWSLLSSPRLDTSRRPRIVLEIAAFSRYFPGLRSGEFRVYPSRLILSPTISPSRLQGRTKISFVGELSVTNYVSCRLHSIGSSDSLRCRALSSQFLSRERIIVSDASSGIHSRFHSGNKPPLISPRVSSK